MATSAALRKPRARASRSSVIEGPVAAVQLEVHAKRQNEVDIESIRGSRSANGAYCWACAGCPMIARCEVCGELHAAGAHLQREPSHDFVV